MRSRHSFYEILKYPIEVLFIAWIMIGIGNLLSNGSLGIVYSIENDTIIILAEMLVKAGQFLVVNFPFIFLIRLSARQTGSATSIISSVCGYISYLTATMVFASGSLPSTAYSSIFGLSISNSASAALSHSTHYPLQTGMIGAFIVAMITLWSFNRSKVRNVLLYIQGGIGHPAYRVCIVSCRCRCSIGMAVCINGHTESYQLYCQ